MLPAAPHATTQQPRRVLSLLLVLTFGLSFALGLRAEPLAFPTLTTTKGVTYTDVKVSRFDALEVRFSHTNGIATVPLAELPPALQTLFGYDPKNEIHVLKDKQSQRAQAIITEADQKAKAAAIRQQEEADAQELQRIRSSPLRCYISRVQHTEDALLIDVSATDKLPVMVPSRTGRSDRVKLTPQGRPEYAEQAVPGKAFVLGPTLRILPSSVPLTAGKIISVYVITTEVGPEPICATSPEAALEYRKKLAAYKAAGNTPPPSTATPPGSAPLQGSANP
ncbi:hypothetical protein [Prosthecobacter sp.]|uniref:hypothetical protein n=1 Tax=Prosthecobacter sp. TaxID=1965333 RepID=UPI0037830395